MSSQPSTSKQAAEMDAASQKASEAASAVRKRYNNLPVAVVRPILAGKPVGNPEAEPVDQLAEQSIDLSTDQSGDEGADQSAEQLEAQNEDQSDDSQTAEQPTNLSQDLRSTSEDVISISDSESETSSISTLRLDSGSTHTYSLPSPSNAETVDSEQSSGSEYSENQRSPSGRKRLPLQRERLSLKRHRLSLGEPKESSDGASTSGVTTKSASTRRDLESAETSPPQDHPTNSSTRVRTSSQVPQRA